MRTVETDHMTIAQITFPTGNRTVYSMRKSEYAPTNPKEGVPTLGNTVVWNPQTQIAQVVAKEGIRTSVSWGSETGKPTYPTTTEEAAYRLTYTNPRSAPQVLRSPGTTTGISRTSTETNWNLCDTNSVTICAQGVYSSITPSTSVCRIAYPANPASPFR